MTAAGYREVGSWAGGTYPSGAVVVVGYNGKEHSRNAVAWAGREASLLDAAREGERIEGLNEYGWKIRLEVHAFVRDQVRFGSVESLVAQIDRDCGRVRSLMKDAPVRTGAAV